MLKQSLKQMSVDVRESTYKSSRLLLSPRCFSLQIMSADSIHLKAFASKETNSIVNADYIVYADNVSMTRVLLLVNNGQRTESESFVDISSPVILKKTISLSPSSCIYFVYIGDDLVTFVDSS